MDTMTVLVYYTMPEHYGHNVITLVCIVYLIHNMHSPPPLSSGMSTLHWAVDGEQIKTIEYLLNQGIPVRDNILFLTPHFPPLRLMMLLTLQSLAGRLCCALVITILFVFIFTFYAHARTHTAATNGNTIIAQKLISHGADINKRDSQGQTPLMVKMPKTF